jgi:hypothetical protein
MDTRMLIKLTMFQIRNWSMIFRIRVRVEQDGPCIRTYVLSIIWNFILYIGLKYMYISHIIFCMVLNTRLHIKFLYEGLDNVFVLHNLQCPNSFFQVFPWIVFVPIQILFWYFHNVNFCHQQLCKITPLTYEFKLIWNFCVAWKTMFIIIFQNFNSFDFIKW